MRPVVSMVAEQESSVDFYYVDLDTAPELASMFGVQSLPTLIQIKNGQETNRSRGFIPEEEIRGFAHS